MKRLLTVILCVLCLMSCERNKIKRTLKTFYKSEIMIPDDLTCIYKRTIRTASADSFATCKFIVYYDTLDCSSCRVAHLNDFAPMYELAEDDDRFDDSSFGIFIDAKDSAKTSASGQSTIASYKWYWLKTSDGNYF